MSVKLKKSRANGPMPESPAPEISNPVSEPKDTRLIREITLRNILSFGPDTPPFELKPLNVLIGANGSGKSNLICCIELMRSTRTDFDQHIRDKGGVREWIGKNSPLAEGSIRLLFSESEKYSQAKEVSHELFLNNHSNGSAFLREEFYQGESSLDLSEYHLKVPGKSAIDLANSIPNVYALSEKNWANHQIIYRIRLRYDDILIYKDVNVPLLRGPQRVIPDSIDIKEDFSNLTAFVKHVFNSQPRKQRLLDELQNFSESVTNFSVNSITEDWEQLEFNEEGIKISSDRISDGTLRYLCLLAILCNPDPPPLICIEEPELGLHPDVLGGLAELLIEASTRTQLIVTTHSDILVEAMTETPESVVVCEKNDGKTEMHRLTQGEVEPWLDKYRLGELWLRGGIGGKRW